MIAVKKLYIIAVLTVWQPYAYAANYYVDSALGNDSWSGKLPAAVNSPSPNGPWQSLNRLATATLSPGDVVELKCGSKWIQTLRLKNSGTPERPIVIRSGSSTCGVPPSIDGSQMIDARNWVRHSNAIYKASWPIQKFQNGTLAMGTAGWTSWSASADQKLTYESSCPDSSNGCAAFTSSAKPGSIAISNDFLVEGGLSYSGELSLRIPTGINIKVLVRRGSPPYDTISAVQWITGTSVWQKVSFAFLPRTTVPNARLDIEVPDGGVKLHFKNASLIPAFANPLGAWIGGLPLLPAYHPNRGHDASRPNSVYANIAADGNAIPISYGGTGSNYLDIDPTLKLPEGVIPKPGNRLRIRSAPWNVDEVTITQVMGTRLYFQPTTRYRVRAGQGYFLLGELGMLDAPGEWLYDAATGFTYTWMPDGNAPSDQIRLSTLEKGVDLSSRSNVTIEGVDIRYTGLGIDLTKARNIKLNSIKLAKTVREGILANEAKDISITASRFYRTGGDAISASTTSALSVKDNDITESAVVMDDGLVWSLPAPAFAAIMTGSDAIVTGNRISYSGGNGIWVLANGTVEHNAIQDSCLQINDCAGIYVNYASRSTRIASNLVERVSGNTDGMNSNILTHAVGIYLDDLSTNMVVESNAVAGADFGIQLHNAHDNRIIGNLLYGNRNHQLWFQENTNKSASTGDIYGNEASGNRFFPTTSAAAVTIEGQIGSLTKFGILSGNKYSALFSKRVVSESWPEHNLAYTLDEWKSPLSGVGRLLQDKESTQLIQEGYATYLAASANIVPNGGLKNGPGGWSSWNATAPMASRMYEVCPSGPCIKLTAGGSASLLSTPNFSVESGRAYRVSFDAKTATNGQFIAPLVRRGGPGTLFESLMPASEGFSGSIEWRRYAFVFTAAKTVNAGDPVTGDLGARLDFTNILPNQILWIANVEIVPLLAVENTLRTQFITNPDRITQSRECPDQETAPEYCDRYHIFPEGTPVSWPINLPPLGTLSMYTLNQATLDSDADDIADSEDLCPGTSKNDQVNAAGCALTQLPGQQ